ncbi:MAG TPA: DUF1501 domain-containing protein [Pirellulales bacterium]|nr:DUF1501 domain-containing protein [Pirellulales bacterium]
MLAISDTRPTHHCQGFSRRDFLRVGAIGSGALGLSGLLATRAHGDAASIFTGRSVVLVFLQGGPPHIEFFDPKMTAPREIRSITGEVQTRLPGITFGATFPQLAQRADRIAIVRSYGSGNVGHTYNPVVTGGEAAGPAVSAVYARVRGTNHPQSGLPTNVLVLPEAVRDNLKFESNFETAALPTLTQAGTLGQTYSAFDPSGGSDLKHDMQLKLPTARLESRLLLLRELDDLRRRAELSKAIENFSYYQQQAFDVVVRGVAAAFDLSKEDPATLARYDTSHLLRMEELTRWYDMRRVSNLLGRQLLLARRLCEAGCGFVTVSDCGWDYHANGNSPKQMAGIYGMGGQVDHALSAFIDDVRERGLEDKILLVVTGEMGRTPRLNGNGGREHYGELTPLLLFGGGLKMGQVIGQSDGQASRPSTEPYRPQHLISTIMHTLFDVGQLRLAPNMPREVLRLTEIGKPIDQLSAA